MLDNNAEAAQSFELADLFRHTRRDPRADRQRREGRPGFSWDVDDSSARLLEGIETAGKANAVG